MRAWTAKCDCGSRDRYVLTKSSVARLVCECGTAWVSSQRHMTAPPSPVREMAWPVVRANVRAFGCVRLYRKIIGTRTANGKTEILCRYGEDIEKWYAVAA